jgi:hypothetical protein
MDDPSVIHGVQRMRDGDLRALELRAIRVSARAAMASHGNDGAQEWIRSRTQELLAALEADVLRDGADPAILAAIEAARREFDGS